MNNDGWIKLHRDAGNHWVFKDRLAWQIWCWLLFRANYKPLTAKVDGALRTIGTGEVLTSLEQIAESCQTTVQRVRTVLLHLENDGMVRKIPTRGATHISICNYGAYQEQQQAEQHPSNIRATSEQQDVKNVRSKEGKNNNNVLGNVAANPPTYEQWQSVYLPLRQSEQGCLDSYEYYRDNKWRTARNVPLKSWERTAREAANRDNEKKPLLPTENELGEFLTSKFAQGTDEFNFAMKHANAWYIDKQAHGMKQYGKTIVNWRVSLLDYITKKRAEVVQ